ncbi:MULTISPECIES: hypothetical protein [Bacillus cereus group]|nr:MULTISPECIES: hypothetical protein [Bacillus cereus group]MDA1909656.1 hypothetical protein [Bacillus cereus]MDA2434935.1 hypothetical protein [Bacillus cereus]MDA2716787.1 hypothetical protein [Bacillus cereus group sp. Bc025]
MTQISFDFESLVAQYSLVGFPFLLILIGVLLARFKIGGYHK